MNLPALILLTCACTLTACGQGTIYFQNRGGSINGQIEAPILNGLDSTALAGDRFSAQLWVGRSVDSLAPVLESRTVFRSPVPAHGYIVALVVSVPDIAPEERAWVQVRAWENTAGVTGWENAWLRGESNVFSLVLGGDPGNGDPILPPPIIVGMQTFYLFPIPEPSGIALTLMSFVACLFLPRRM